MTDTGVAGTARRRIALVLTQKRDSGNWDPAGYAAARSMADRHGFALEIVEEIGFNDAARVFSELARAGVELVMGHASDYAGPMLDVAPAHPDTMFGVFSYVTTTGDLSNLAGWTVSWNEVEFLTGVVAGLASKRGHIGTVRGVELVPAEFALGNLVRGARHVNPDIRVEVEHIKDWNDFDGARESTRRLAGLGCDVIYGAADSADATIQGTCAELGALTFGEYVDEGDAFPGAIITSFMVNESRAYDEMGAMLSAGTWTPGIRVMDAASGDIRFAEFRNVQADVRPRFEEIYRQIASGELTISD
jgi:basic membrane protein A and related proteins